MAFDQRVARFVLDGDCVEQLKDRTIFCSCEHTQETTAVFPAMEKKELTELKKELGRFGRVLNVQIFEAYQPIIHSRQSQSDAQT